MIGMRRDARCDLCEENVWDQYWSLHEVAEGEWLVVCESCELTTGIGEGK